MSGGEAYIANIFAIADALGVKFETLLDGYQPPTVRPADAFRDQYLPLRRNDFARSAHSLATLTPDIVASLAKIGITINVQQSQLSIVDHAGYDIRRIIMLVYGLLDTGGSFWCYVAVKPSKYREFVAIQKQGTLNLYKIDPLGEIIVSGQGATPPEEVTRKVAELFHADYDSFFQPMQLDKYLPPEHG